MKAVVAAAVTGGRIPTSLPPATAAATTPATLQILRTLTLSGSPMPGSSGNATSSRRNRAISHDGQSS